MRRSRVLMFLGLALLWPGAAHAEPPTVAVRLSDWGDGPKPEKKRSVTALAFSEDGRTVTAVGSDGAVVVWDAATGKARNTLEWAGSRIVLSGDGAAAAGVSDKGTTRVLETASGKVLYTVRRGFLSGPLALSPDGNLLAGSSGLELTLCELPSGLERRLAWPFHPTAGAFSPDDSFLAAVHQDPPLPGTISSPSEIRFWDVSAGDEVRNIPLRGRLGLIRFVGFSPDGRLLATGYDRTGVSLYEAATGGLRTLTPIGGRGGCSCFAFSPDGRFIVISQYDRERDHCALCLCDIYTGEEVCSFRDYTGEIHPLAFSPEGKRLAVGRDDGTTDVWDVAAALGDKAWPAAEPTAQELDDLWGKLAGGDAEAAHQAVGALSHAARDGPAFLRERLEKLPPRLEKLVAVLDDDDFEVRERATRELSEAGRVIAAALRRKLDAGDLPLEARLRVERILQAIDNDRKDAPAAIVSWLRATEALERLGTPEARAALEKQADGVGEGPALAKASLERLKKQPEK
jgi:hypothetical protein